MYLVGSLLLGLAYLTGALSTMIPGPHTRATGRSPGCGSAPTITSGVKSLTVNGKQRQFTIRVPRNYQKDNGYKVIIGLHWVGGTMDQVAGGGTTGEPWAYYGMQKMANESAILVAPQGLNNGWANSGGEDILFIDAINKYIDSGLCVNQAQRFSMGFSYGAAMTYAIACARAKDFRAVTVIAGGQLSGCSGGNVPVAYFGIHGVSDGTLNIAGGRTMRDRFVKNNGCASMAGAPEPRAGSRTHMTTAATGCKPGYPVLWAAHDGGHGPAPADAPAPSSDDGLRTWMPAAVWAFYTQAQLASS
ncbi:hypothetical protein B0H65DRAFT_212156 [Neurospora tetraspora]|uniref:Feruloyl esterase C n=1 Tax=Neurospora tetraspora TaxID=94610 RepID=A0AAE0JG24_9PEZI|nr:hypothetical protein B0H65DRAFT_212156 [Neurospora tetraspora]